MSLRMLLDGPDLRGIIKEVEGKYGRNFRVVKAEQVRTGGVAGFFAKQHYEVTVEISDPKLIARITGQPVKKLAPASELATRSQNDQAAASAEAWAKDLLQKARELNELKVAVPAPPPQPAQPRGVPLLEDDAQGAGGKAASGRGGKMRTRLPGKKKANGQPSDRMLRATNEQQSRLRELLAQRSPIVEDIPIEDDDATENGAKAEAVAPAAKKPRKKAAPSKPTSNAPAATTTRKKKSTTATPQVNVAVVNSATEASFAPAAPAPEPTTAEAPVAEPKATVPSEQEPIRIHRETVAASPLDIRDDATEDFWRARIAEEIRQQRDKVQRFYARRGTVTEEQARNLKIFELTEAIALGQDVAPATVHAAEVRSEQPPTPHAPEVPQEHEVAQAPEVRQATEVPQREVLDMTAEIPVVTATISAAVEQAPSLPPLNSGEILVLVGDAHEAYQQACAIIKECERPETHVFAVAPSSVTLPLLRAEEHFGHADAYQLVDVVTELDVPAIVVVHAPLSMLLNEAEKVRVLQAVTSLNSRGVWAVVDAAWRTESLRRWVRSLEGVTALVVTNEAQSADPEALTGIGIPIALRNEKTRSTPSRKAKAPASAHQVGSLPV